MKVSFLYIKKTVENSHFHKHKQWLGKGDDRLYLRGIQEEECICLEVDKQREGGFPERPQSSSPYSKRRGEDHNHM